MLKLFNRPIPLASAHKKASGAVRFLRLSRNCRTFLFNCLTFLFIVQLFYRSTATGGDVRRVQKLSRHANLNTLMIYDDNRLNVQGDISAMLADMV
jgi:hypothetical protein